MAVFTVNCVGIAWLSEILGLKTSIPFGSYSLTSVIGPQMFGLPFLTVLAYLGIAYCSWTLALLILGIAKKPFRVGIRSLRLFLRAASSSRGISRWSRTDPP